MISLRTILFVFCALCCFPAQASRVLYVYSDDAGNTYSAIRSSTNDPPFAQYVPTVSCFAEGAFCDKAYFNSGRFAGHGFFQTGPDEIRSTFSYNARIIPGVYGTNPRLVTTLLNPTDVVYSFADNTGDNYVAVTNGYLPRSVSGHLNTVSCRGGVFCDYAEIKTVDVFGTEKVLTGGGVFNINALSVPGTYTFAVPGFVKELTVVGPLVSTVPVPASAPMLSAALLGLAGLGYVAKHKKAAAI